MAASGTGRSPLASRFACTKPSMGVSSHARSVTGGGAWFVMGRNDRNWRAWSDGRLFPQRDRFTLARIGCAARRAPLHEKGGGVPHTIPSHNASNRVSWRDGDRCAARMALACERETGAAGAQISTSVLDAWARKLASAGCIELPASEDLAACDLRGRLTTGQACGAGSQCASGVCVREDLCGICTARAAPGAPCEHQDACAMDSSCVGGTCERDVQEGAECDPAGTPCAAGLVCRASRCGPAAAAGEACRESDECDESPHDAAATVARIAATGSHHADARPLRTRPGNIQRGRTHWSRSCRLQLMSFTRRVRPSPAAQTHWPLGVDHFVDTSEPPVPGSDRPADLVHQPKRANRGYESRRRFAEA